MKALLSVYDKTGVVELATALHELGWELLSSGGTAKVVAEAGVPVTDVAELTGVPGHPRPPGRDPAPQGPRRHPRRPHRSRAPGRHGHLRHRGHRPRRGQPLPVLVEPVDRADRHRRPGHGPGLGQEPPVRRHRHRPGRLRRRARRAPRRRHALAGHPPPPGPSRVRHHRGLRRARSSSGSTPVVPSRRSPTTAPTRRPRSRPRSSCPTPSSSPSIAAQVLRYGENPHQVGARYAVRGADGWWDTAVQHGGKEMSYLNVYDTEAAWRLVHSLGTDPTAVVIKHANPCGVAVADDITEAYIRAHNCDTDLRLRRHRRREPPGHRGHGRGAGAGVHRGARRPRLRARRAAPPAREAQPAHPRGPAARRARAARCAPSTAATWCRPPTSSPSIARSGRSSPRWPRPRPVARPRAGLAGRRQGHLERHRAGEGPPGRSASAAASRTARDAGRLACEKADGRAAGGVYASDAFFPFADGLDGAIEAGAATVIEPGGSIRDEEVIAAADAAGLAMVFTGERHFRH